MGLFDKLKALKNYVTGGGAEVHLEIGEPRLGEPFPVRVRAQIGDAPMTVARIYVIARGEETVDLVVRDRDAGRPDLDRVHETAVTSEHTFELVRGPLRLAPGSSHEWETEVLIPLECEGTYHGRNARHRWLISAGLDIPGNDPDSGWVEVEIY